MLRANFVDVSERQSFGAGRERVKVLGIDYPIVRAGFLPPAARSISSSLFFF